MPVKIPNDLPAASILESENIFVMTDSRADTQDIRPLDILVVNLMPTKVETETQLLRCLSNSPLQTNVEFLKMTTHNSKNTSHEYLDRFYTTFPEVRDRKFDGVIITGAPVETLPFEEVDYWPELCEIMDWTLTNSSSALYICWGSQAGLYHHYGVPKYSLDSKVSGIFEHRVLAFNEPILRGFDDRFFMPQSRHTEMRGSDIAANPHLHIVASSPETGPGIIVSERNEIFITGHFEYDRGTLAYEYERDMDAGKNPHIPDHYFEDDDPHKDPVVRWRCHATMFFTNWLNYCVYQETPYERNDIGRSSLRDDLRVDELADDGVADERVEPRDVLLAVQDRLDARGHVREHGAEYPAGVPAVVLQAAFVVRVHAAAAVAVPVDVARGALLPAGDGARQDAPESLGGESLGQRSDLVDAAHAELLRTGLGAGIDRSVGIHAYPFREARRVGAVRRRRIAQIVQDIQIVGYERDLGVRIVQPFVECLDASGDVLVRIGHGVAAQCASRRYNRRQGHVGPPVPEEAVYLRLLRSRLPGDGRAHGVLVLLGREHGDGLLGIELPEDAVPRPLPGHPDVDGLLPAVGHEAAIEKRPVRLYGVPDAEAPLSEMLLLQLDGRFVERHGERHGLPSVPDEPDCLVFAGYHPEEPVQRIQRNLPGDALLGGVIAVAATLVAIQGRLDDDRDIWLHGRRSPDQKGQYVQTPLKPLVT